MDRRKFLTVSAIGAAAVATANAFSTAKDKNIVYHEIVDSKVSERVLLIYNPDTLKITKEIAKYVDYLSIDKIYGNYISREDFISRYYSYTSIEYISIDDGVIQVKDIKGI